MKAYAVYSASPICKLFDRRGNLRRAEKAPYGLRNPVLYPAVLRGLTNEVNILEPMGHQNPKDTRHRRRIPPDVPPKNRCDALVVRRFKQVQ